MAASTVQAQKVYWVGRHAVVPQLGSPVSKLHREGLRIMRSLGWTQVQNDTACIPAFAFTTRKGANYPAGRPGLPVVRQLPHAHTACLDDKRSMAQNLTAAGLQHLMPTCWDSIEAYQASAAAQQQQQEREQGLEQLQQQQQVEAAEQVEQQQRQQQQEAEDAVHEHHLPQLQLHGHAQLLGCATSASANAGDSIDSRQRHDAAAGSSHSSHIGALLRGGTVTAPNGGSDRMQAEDAASASSSSGCSGVLLPGGSVYVKHRRGVKGQAVYVARTMQQLLQLQHRLKGNSRKLVVQQEVPPLLLQGRKFVMRLHVLVVPQLPQQQQQRGLEAGVDPARAAVHGHVHRDVIVLQHAKQYDPASDDSAVHISSRGKQHPVPALLGQSQLPIDLQDSIWQQLQKLAVQCIAAVSHLLLPTAVHSDAVLYHLFGFDCMVDATGRVVLLEVNSFRAIASGTMSGVDVRVYTRLVGELVRLLVLPVADGVAPEPGGFVDVTHLL